MDDKLKIKQDKLIEMVTAFGDEYLDEEYTYLSVELIKKMGRKRDSQNHRQKGEYSFYSGCRFRGADH